MRYSNLLSLVVAFFLLPRAFAIPVTSRPQSPTPTFAHGDYVGVRPTAYEEKHPSHKKISIHPGIIVGGPDPTTGKHEVAMISKKPPNNPPQEPIENFQTGTGIYGNVVLKARPISPGAMKPWKNGDTGAPQTPLVGPGYNKLKTAMAPHVNWRPPTPPPRAPTPPGQPVQQKQNSPPRTAGNSNSKGGHQQQRVNTNTQQASGSRGPPRGGHQAPSGQVPAQRHQASASSSNQWRNPAGGAPGHGHGSQQNTRPNTNSRPPAQGQGQGHGHGHGHGYGSGGSGGGGSSGSRHPPSTGTNSRASASGSRPPVHGAPHSQHQQGSGSGSNKRPPSPGSNARHASGSNKKGSGVRR